MPKPIDIQGQRFGRLLVVTRGEDYLYANGKRARRWVCRCDCGETILTYAGGLRSGHVRSCGCLQRDIVSKRGTRHGMANTPEYKVWGAMRARCQNPEHESYANYGARGIKVCARWNESFEAFITDMGRRPTGLTLERRNNNGDYEPANCFWATRLEQGRNKRNSVFITFEGETLIVSEWARRLNTSPTALRQRWKKFATLRPVGRHPARSHT